MNHKLSEETSIEGIIDQRIYNGKLEYLVERRIYTEPNPAWYTIDRQWIDYERMEILTEIESNKTLFNRYLQWFEYSRNNEKRPSSKSTETNYMKRKDLMQNLTIPITYEYLHREATLKYSVILINLMLQLRAENKFGFDVGFRDDLMQVMDRRIIEIQTWRTLHSAWITNETYHVCTTVLGSPAYTDLLTFSEILNFQGLQNYGYSSPHLAALGIKPYLGVKPIIVMQCQPNSFTNTYWSAMVIQINGTIDHYVAHLYNYSCGYSLENLYTLASLLKIIDPDNPLPKINNKMTTTAIDPKVKRRYIRYNEIRRQRKFKIRHHYGVHLDAMDSMFITAESITKLLNEQNKWISDLQEVHKIDLSSNTLVTPQQAVEDDVGEIEKWLEKYTLTLTN